MDETQEAMLRSAMLWHLLGDTDLNTKITSTRLSARDAQQLRLASILIGDKPVWLLDGPLDGLGKSKRRVLLDAIITAASGRTVVVSMSQAVELDRFDCILELSKGRVSFFGSPNDYERKRADASPNTRSGSWEQARIA